MSEQSWVDSHCHLPEAEAADLVAEARAAEVGLMITVGCDRETSREALALAGRFPEVHATVGLHPHEAKHGVESITDLFDGTGGVRPVAVGECGLDFHYDHSPRDDQRAAFARQIELANRRGLPLVIHTREAWDETFAILDTEGVPWRTVFHCFTGGPAEAARCLDRGAYVSFSGIVTFPGGAGRPRCRRPRAARPHARRDRQPVPRPGPQPGPTQPTGMGAARRRLPRRGPRRCCRGDPEGDRGRRR